MIPMQCNNFLTSSVRHGVVVLLFALAFAGITVEAFALLPEADANAADQNNEAQAEPVVVDRDVARLTPKITELGKRRVDMLSEVVPLTKVEPLQDKLLELSKTRNQLIETFHQVKIDPQSNLEQVSEVQSQINKVEIDAEALVREVGGYISQIDLWIDFWDKEADDVSLWREGLGPANELEVVTNQIDRLDTLIQLAQQEVNDALGPLFRLQQEAGALEMSIHELKTEADFLFQANVRERSGVSFLFSADFLDEFNPTMWGKVELGIAQIFDPDFSVWIGNEVQISGALLIFIALVVVLRLFKDSLQGRVSIRFLAQRPVDVALFLGLSFFLFTKEDLSRFWLSLLWAVALFCFYRIGRLLILKPRGRRILVILLTLMIAADLIVVFSMPQALIRIYIFVLCLIFLILLTVLTQRSVHLLGRADWIVWFGRFGMAVFAIIILGEMVGLAQFSIYLFFASIRSLFALIYVWVMYRVLMGVVEALLISVPVPLVREQAEPMTRALRPIMFIIAGFYTLVFLLVDWRLFTTPREAMEVLTNLNIGVGSTAITVGLVAAALFTLYGAYWISKTIEFVLLKTVLPQRRIDLGIQLSITRLVHYAFMLIGFLLAVGMLGFNMTNLTILGGALGVGIGFGLQAIVNNFVSGLILLFERPVKVGDTIQVGEETGEVKELGLRATVVQTFDLAEMVIPNGDLVTGMVTNWTLQARRVRVRVPVGVAYGSDVEQVLHILKQCGQEHPLVLDNPQPVPLFLGFGASSLDFELRVFIADMSERVGVRSDLNRAINTALAEAGIEIPFPQNDLHLRSVDQDLLIQLRGGGGEEKNAVSS
jgi:potassium efflux system protein